ncbi:MAG TPA: hypothetical protein VGR37_17660 [Longimicrobiaceae bacterium]|nr:hypothetical protein [Longimicrobiaceae bacterium]
MQPSDRPRNPAQLARQIVRLVGAHRVERIVGLQPVSPPEGHAFYAFVVLRDAADDARGLEKTLYERFSPKRPRIDYWIMGREEWERSRMRIGHPARVADQEGKLLYGAAGGGAEESVA